MLIFDLSQSFGGLAQLGTLGRKFDLALGMFFPDAGFVGFADRTQSSLFEGNPVACLFFLLRPDLRLARFLLSFLSLVNGFLFQSERFLDREDFGVPVLCERIDHAPMIKIGGLKFLTPNLDLAAYLA